MGSDIPLAREGKILVGEKQINLKKWRTLLSSATKILAVDNAVTLTKRKSSLRPYLDSKFHTLLKPTNPITNIYSWGLTLNKKFLREPAFRMQERNWQGIFIDPGFGMLVTDRMVQRPGGLTLGGEMATHGGSVTDSNLAFNSFVM